MKKLIYAFLIILVALALVLLSVILTEAGYFQSEKNLQFQKKLISALTEQPTVSTLVLLQSLNLNYQYICINGAYISPNDVLNWQREKFEFEKLDLENVINVGYENYWSISLFNDRGVGEFFSLYSPMIQIDTSTEPILSKSCFDTSVLYFERSPSTTFLEGQKHNTVSLIIK